MSTAVLQERLRYLTRERVKIQDAQRTRLYHSNPAAAWEQYQMIMALPVRPSRWPIEAPQGRSGVFRKWYALRRLVDLHEKNEWLAFQQKKEG